MRKRCYGLLDIEMMDPATLNVTPILITEGESGYRRTDWAWSKQYAEQVRDEKNARLGITPQEADRMMGCSMFGWPEREAP